MKHKLKQLTALILTLVMCLNLLYTNAWAAEVVSSSNEDESNAAIYDDAIEFNDHYYYRFDTEMTWSEAKDYCESIGGCLVAITSEEENEFIKSLLVDNVYKAYWLGGYILDGQWYWLTGETWEYTNWHSGEPNGSSNDMCLQMWWSSNQWKWDDTWNSGDKGGGETEQGFICEWNSEQMAALTAPVLSASADGHKTVYLSWTYSGNIESISRFLIYRSEDGVDYTYIHSVATDTNEYYDTLSFETNEKLFYYKVIAFNENGQRSESNIVQVTAVSQDTENPVAVIGPDELTFANINENVNLTAAASFDNDIIDSYKWDFGDGSSGSGVTVSHAYSSIGDYTVTLTVTDKSGNSDTASVIITVVDIDDENSEYSKLILTICDASSLAAINNAQVTIAHDDISDIWNVEQNGTLTCIVPNDSYNVSVCADGYIVRTVKIVANGGTVEATIGLFTGSIMIGELTTSEMTYDEIIEAGIDPEAEGNQHVYKFAAVLTFVAGVKEYEIPYEIIKNENGEVIGSSGSGYYTVEGADTNGGSGNDIRIGIFPISEKFVLIVYGEAHWLKEMYKVELLVTNTSNTDTLEEVIAELKLPNGLSLADMVDGSQSLTQNLGSIGYSGNARACWYVRGDNEGEYNLTAKVSAVTMPFAEEIEQIFTTSIPVKVYAGSALHMTIIAEDVVTRGKEYTVKFKLENVSDKSIYNFSFGITGSEQYKVVGFGDEEVWLPITNAEYGEEWTRKVEELAPGGYVELELSTTIWFNSVLELIEFSKLGAFVDVAYYLTDISVVALEGSTTTIPYDVVVERKERDYLVDKLIKEGLEKLYDEKVSGSLGGTLIEVIGEEVGLSSWMIKGAKTVLKLQQGETDHKLTISIDDGLGNENSIYNDVVYVTTGNGTNALIDTLNGTKLTIEAGEVSIQAKGPGNTKIKIGVTDSAGKMEREYIMDIAVEDIEVKNKITLSPDSVSGSFSLDENSFEVAIEQKREQENEVYSRNPFLWFDSTLVLDISTTTSDSNFSLHMEKTQLEKILDQTATTDVVVDGDTADLNFDREALMTVIENNGDSYTIIARRLTDEEAQELGSNNPTWQLTIQSGDDTVSQFGEGTVDVSVPYEPKDTEDISVEHIKEDGTTEILYAEYDKETGTVNFTTDGFSYFRIVENTDSPVHTYGAPEFTWSEDNTTCTAAFTCVDGDDTQTQECEVTEENMKPTCTENGKIVYTAKVTFQNKEYTDTKTVDGEEATGHTYVYIDNEDGTHTKTCEAGDDSVTENHIYINGTCVCGAEESTEPIDPDNPTHTHTYNEPVFEWSENNTCTAVFTCVEEDDTQTIECTVTNETTKEPTCTEKGKVVYIAEAVFNEQTYTDSKEEEIDAVGHKEETIPAVDPTCTATGLTEGSKCSVCGAILEKQIEIPATGHSYQYTDNDDGTHTAVCVNGDDSFTEEHSFEDGICVCGAKNESEKPSETETPDETESSEETETPGETESSEETESPEEPESSEEPSKPAETVKPFWQSWLEKWFGWNDEPENPTETETPEEPESSIEETPEETEQPSESESESETSAEKPDSPGFNFWDWIFCWWN